MSGPNDASSKVDIFAQIAAQRAEGRGRALEQPQPPMLPERKLPFSRKPDSAAFTPHRKIATAAQLERRLERERRAHAKFQSNLAPEQPATRKRLAIERFDWRVATERDHGDFRGVLDGRGAWQEVRIPHYGAPIGPAVTFYRTTVELDEAMRAPGALFLRFKGVDYKAHVFFNDAYVGSHEGFFAPFEFDVTKAAHPGANVLVVKVENDHPTLADGDKIYAATGPGYDDPECGWHHCPPAMGIYQDVSIEARPRIFVSDIFVRPFLEEERAEAWIEVTHCDYKQSDVRLEYSVYGQNFRQTLVRDAIFEPTTPRVKGFGDIPNPDAEWQALPLQMGQGPNTLRIPFEVPHPRAWEPDSPWLYQLQVRAIGPDGQTLDAAARQFGMRSFTMDETGDPKGRFFLNGREIRLRGANTMGHLQQCVIRKDWDQLRDDLLLTKICNMNFLRLTQRPVQSEIYEACDRLGVMVQSDLPLFGQLRRNQFWEAVRQAHEMERLLRAHPSSIVVSYINEPFPNANGKPHRHLTRDELQEFFRAADIAVTQANPDRVIKPVDGDYDPPAPGLPDNHCYCGWYNGHGLGIGMLHRGYWQAVKPGWFYGCGEFGAEGLEDAGLMRRRYPPEWLPQSPEAERAWLPNDIVGAQTGKFHYMWFETPHALEDWIPVSQDHQARVVRMMTEAFRRDARMNTFALHLFIDAFPSGWMKTIMDCERRPKQAFFAYRDALEPLAVSLRTDRFACFAGEQIRLEAWLCNDRAEAPTGLEIRYRIEADGRLLAAGRSKARVEACSSAFQGTIDFVAPEAPERGRLTVRLALTDRAGRTLHDTLQQIDLFPVPKKDGSAVKRARIYGARRGRAAWLAGCLGLPYAYGRAPRSGEVVLTDDLAAFHAAEAAILDFVREGGTAVFLELPEGDHAIADTSVRIVPCGMGDYFFVSRDTGHALVRDFEPGDFRFWYDAERDYIAPLLSATAEAPEWDAILASGQGAWRRGAAWDVVHAAAERPLGAGRLRLCQLRLADFAPSNPVAAIFARRLLGIDG